MENLFEAKLHIRALTRKKYVGFLTCMLKKEYVFNEQE